MDLFPLALILATGLVLIAQGQDTCENLSIIGGHNVFIQNVPFIAAIFENDKALCAGAIVHESFILTTASCASKGVKINVFLGTARLNKGGQLYEVEKKICHYDYNSYTMDDDICLLKLKSKIKFGRRVRKVVLPQPNIYIADGASLNVTGWGSVDSEGHKFPKRLQQSTVPKISAECCSKVYVGITDSMICAGTRGHDACVGDEGAPLTIDKVLVGLYSSGNTLGCGTGPGIYTKVSAYFNWINTMIEYNS